MKILTDNYKLHPTVIDEPTTDNTLLYSLIIISTILMVSLVFLFIMLCKLHFLSLFTFTLNFLLFSLSCNSQKLLTFLSN